MTVLSNYDTASFPNGVGLAVIISSVAPQAGSPLRSDRLLGRTGASLVPQAGQMGNFGADPEMHSQSLLMNIEPIIKGLESWIYPVSRLMSRIASAFLFLMMLLTVTDVFLRKVYSKSILGTVEVTEFMLLIVIFFALAHTEVLNGHVKVDLVMSRFGPRAQALVDMITQFVCFVLSLLITWSTLVYSEMMRAAEERSQDLWLYVFPFIYIVAAGCAVLALTLLIKTFLALTRLLKS
jgi:TRAP-type C4-dicarboxylate transport system permease small subunit